MTKDKFQTLAALCGLLIGGLVAMSIVGEASAIKLQARNEYWKMHQYDYWFKKANEICGGDLKEFIVTENDVKAQCL